jgi:hypothetical protein
MISPGSPSSSVVMLYWVSELKPCPSSVTVVRPPKLDTAPVLPRPNPKGSFLMYVGMAASVEALYWVEVSVTCDGEMLV